MAPTKSSRQSWHRRLEIRGFLIGIVFVSSLWAANFYHNINGERGQEILDGQKSKYKDAPTVAEMTKRRTEFTHTNFHPHPDEQTQAILAERLVAIGLEPNPGTLDLIDTIAERYGRTRRQVIQDLTAIAAGKYSAALKYDVTFERRLEGDQTPGPSGARPLAVTNLRYEVIQLWRDNNAPRRWKIDRSLNIDEIIARNQRVLPDDPKLVVQSFLDVMPDVMVRN